MLKQTVTATLLRPIAITAEFHFTVLACVLLVACGGKSMTRAESYYSNYYQRDLTQDDDLIQPKENDDFYVKYKPRTTKSQSRFGSTNANDLINFSNR
jgi:hypothetical protein